MIEHLMEAARAAGDILREGFGGEFTREEKGRPTDLVTEYDGRAETCIADYVASRFPEDGILGEEGTCRNLGATRRWIVDPLDGTTSFAHGIPFFSVCIALAVGDEVVAGVVHEPLRGETFCAEAGAGSWLGSRRLQVSSTTDLSRSLLATGFPYDIARNPHRTLETFCAVAPKARGIRRLGSAGLDLAYVAAGRFDGYWEHSLKPWDCAAGILLVKEANGRVSDWTGRPHRLDGLHTLATNGLIHDELLGLLTQP